MNRLETDLKDCYIIETKRFGDDRGYFTSITSKDLEELGFHNFFQESESKSCKGTLRGLHFQKDPYCQAKVVKCTNGAVLDVVVDLRSDSPSYKKYIAVELTPENGRMLFVPRGFAHGFLALTENSTFEYLVDNEYKVNYEGGIPFDDKEVAIPWNDIFQKYGIKETLLSKKDSNRISLKEQKELFKRKNPKFLITGASGQLGYDIKMNLLLHGVREEDILCPTSKEMDITNRDMVLDTVNSFSPDVIFHAAAYTNVDEAETNSIDCWNRNAYGTKYISEAAKKNHSKLIYISTDYVFDGTKEGAYEVGDETNPINWYGKTKLMGETFALENPLTYVVRTSWVFGKNGKNFVKTMIQLGKNKKEVNVVSDQLGSPTYTYDLARLLVEMAYEEKYGIYHATNEGYTSWNMFAKKIYEIYGLNTKVNSITTEEYLKMSHGKVVAQRPMNSCLSKDSLEKSGFSRLPSWEDATNRFVLSLKKGIR